MDILNQVNAYGVYSLSQSCWVIKKNTHKRIFPASITKLLTALLVLEHCQMKEKIRIRQSPQAPQFRADLRVGTHYTIQSLMQGLLIGSLNDIAITLSKIVTYRAKQPWQQLTKQYCQKIGMNKSQFVNPNGLHNPAHYATIHDLILLGKKVYPNTTLMNILKMPRCKLLTANGKKPVVFKNLNTLLQQKGVIAGKTGFTPKAGKCFLFFFEKNNQIYVASYAGIDQQNFEKVTFALIDAT